LKKGPFAILNRAAPIITAAILAGIILTRPGQVRAVEGTDDYFASVRSAVETIPYKVGSWLGRDVAVAPAAVKLLQPNAIIQRQYDDQTSGAVLQLLVVHCGNTLDMQGHYPPVCYPAHGWRQVSSETLSVPVEGVALPATLYRFARVVDGVERQMSVINFFVVPRGDEQFFADMGALNSASRSVVTAGLGAAQVQIVSFDARVDLRNDPAVARFLEAVGPVLRVIAEGVRSDGT